MPTDHLTDAAEHFGLFLTALRRGGVLTGLSDAEVAGLLADALDVLTPDDDDVAAAAADLYCDLYYMREARLLADDNGAA